LISKGIHYLAQNHEFICGYTNRNAGINPLWGFNLGFNTNENPDDIKLNRLYYENTLGKNLHFAYANQVHSANIQQIDSPGTYPDIDGFLTSKRRLVLNIQTADCLGIGAVDSKAGIMGAFHAGWKGTYGKITTKGIQQMIKLGAKANQIQVFIGPGIGSCCYEVGEDFKDKFQPNVLKERNQKFYLDLKEENINQCLELGIKQINAVSECTFENKDFFSFRRQKDLAGRMCFFMALV
jgi:hypothetical protein